MPRASACVRARLAGSRYLELRMTLPLNFPLNAASTGHVACWRTIGVRGDHSCPELAEHVHCRNCPVYSAAALTVLDGELSEQAVRERSAHLAVPKTVEGAST